MFTSNLDRTSLSRSPSARIASPPVTLLRCSLALISEFACALRISLVASDSVFLTASAGGGLVAFSVVELGASALVLAVSLQAAAPNNRKPLRRIGVSLFIICYYPPGKLSMSLASWSQSEQDSIFICAFCDLKILISN